MFRTSVTEPLRAGKASTYVETITPHLYVPSAERPVRAKCRWLEADTQVKPHRHPWGQLAISTTGTIRLTVAQGTYIVPPSRALWVPPDMEHAVTMVESADLRTMYFYQTNGRCGPNVSAEQEAHWRQCRVLNASALLRAVVRENLGSTCITTALLFSLARNTHLNVMGWCSAQLLPMIRMASAFMMSL